MNSVPLSETVQAGFAVDYDQRIQLARNPSPGDARIGDQAEVFAAAVVIHRQNAEFAIGAEGVGQKVQGSAQVRPQRDRHRCAVPRPLAATKTAH